MSVSHRTVIGAVASSPAIPINLAAAPSRAIAIAIARFELGGEAASLIRRWSALEFQMMDDPTWAALSLEERRLTPAQVALKDLDTSKEAVQDRQHELLDQLVAVPTTDVSDAVAKLSVALAVMMPDDYPYCHELITDVAKSPATHSCPSCRMAMASSQVGKLLAEVAKVWDNPTVEAEVRQNIRHVLDILRPSLQGK